MNNDLYEQMIVIGQNARLAQSIIANADTNTKNSAIEKMAYFLDQTRHDIITANKIDIQNAQNKGLDKPMIDRLLLDNKRLDSIIDSLKIIADLPDPVGRKLSNIIRPNGLDITKISVPIGVIGIIYESRPNVTADAGALAMKAGNAVILRGGSESFHSSKAIHNALIMGLESVGLSKNIIQLIDNTDRAAVGYMLSDMVKYIDLIIPRGGKSLVARVAEQAKVPILAHLEGICHSYIHKDADENKALDIVINAKMRRTSVCGATETLLVDTDFSQMALLKILDKLSDMGCQIRGCEKICTIYDKAILAVPNDWNSEYLDAILSVKIVENHLEAMEHIAQYSSLHTDAIISENTSIAEEFLSKVQSAIVVHNASTQFADGGEFGMGAEIGIATGKIHARGPVGLEQLNCFKYQLRGNGQIRG